MAAEAKARWSRGRGTIVSPLRKGTTGMDAGSISTGAWALAEGACDPFLESTEAAASSAIGTAATARSSLWRAMACSCAFWWRQTFAATDEP